MKSEIVYFGSEIKLNIGLEPIGDYSMDDYGFECEFYCYSNRRVVLTKDGMLRQDKDNYVAVLDSKSIGTGSLKCKITAYIPDVDCEDGLRTEVLSLDTGIQIQGA
jgi:hypothetical protein